MFRDWLVSEKNKNEIAENILASYAVPFVLRILSKLN
jgi:hypothetical protein